MSDKQSQQTIFLASEIDQCLLEQAAFAVLPVPYEKTVSYGSGTARGPEAILAASEQLETWDGHSNPSSLGIQTCATVDCSGKAEDVINDIAKAVKQILDAGSMPVVLGGEHTVTYGVIKAYLDAGITDFGVVQIDAHADLRDAYEGDPLSHASVMKRIVDEGIPLYQLGIRAYCEEEKAIRESNPHIYYQDADELVPQAIQSIQLPDAFPEKVFFTVDIDGLGFNILTKAQLDLIASSMEDFGAWMDTGHGTNFSKISNDLSLPVK